MFRGGDTAEDVERVANLDTGSIDYLGVEFFSEVFLGLYHDAHGNEVTRRAADQTTFYVAIVWWQVPAGYKYSYRAEAEVVCIQSFCAAPRSQHPLLCHLHSLPAVAPPTLILVAARFLLSPHPTLSLDAVSSIGGSGEVHLSGVPKRVPKPGRSLVSHAQDTRPGARVDHLTSQSIAGRPVLEGLCVAEGIVKFCYTIEQRRHR